LAPDLENAVTVWQVNDAEARFDELLEASLHKGPQIISAQDVEVAVLLAIRDWRRLNAADRRSLKELLLSQEGPRDLLVPERGSGRD
jgi:prevent-host-death family protein